MATQVYSGSAKRPYRGLSYAVAGLFLLPLAACDDEDGLIVINNQSARAVTSVVIDPCSATTTGPNKITAPIPDGGQRTFRVGFGCYNVNIVTDDNLTGEWEELDVSRRDRRIELFAEPPTES